MEKVAVITGSQRGIGLAIKELFIKEGIKVCGFDLLDNDYFIGDTSKKEDLEAFYKKVIKEHKKIDYLIHNAPPKNIGINQGSYEAVLHALKQGPMAVYYLSHLFKDDFNEGGSIINISSTRSKMSQPFTESYSASKGAIDALTHAMAISFQGHVRVNAISPGWINTSNDTLSDEDYHQHPTKTIGNPKDIAQMVLYLVSDKASFINGENITIDGGMSKQMIYHNDFGWYYKK